MQHVKRMKLKYITFFLLIGLMSGSLIIGYTFWMTQSNRELSNDSSNLQSATIGAPDPPTLMPIMPNPNTDGIINLTWVPASVAPDPYYVFRDTSNITSVAGLTPIANITTTNYTDTITTSGIYYYVIIAWNFAGNSSISNCESVVVQIPGSPVPGFELILVFMGLLAVLIYNFRREDFLHH